MFPYLWNRRQWCLAFPPTNRGFVPLTLNGEFVTHIDKHPRHGSNNNNNINGLV